MVNHPFVAFFQTVVLFVAVVGNIVVQYMAYTNLNKLASLPAEVQKAREFLLWNMILQGVALLLLLAAGVIFMIYKTSMKYSNAVFYSVMIICGALLFGGSIMGVINSRKLECIAGTDPSFKKALEMISWSSLIGIIAPFLLIFIQTFAKDQDPIKQFYELYHKKRTPLPPVPGAKPVVAPVQVPAQDYAKEYARQQQQEQLRRQIDRMRNNPNYNPYRARMPRYNPSLYSPGEDMD